MGSILKAALMIFLAELGDKTQLLVLSCATQFSPRIVLLGIACSSMVLFGTAVLLGAFIGNLIPAGVLHWIIPLTFIGCGVWFILGKTNSATAEKRQSFSSFLTISCAFMLAEMGDKTQLAAFSLASEQGQSSLFIWIGAVLGMIAADASALYVGCVLGKKLPQKLIKNCAGILFILYGIFGLIRR